MKYNFDKIIDRSNTNALSIEGFRPYLFEGQEQQIDLPCAEEELVMMWVADMEFELAPAIRAAVKARLDHGIQGYTMLFDGAYQEAFRAWTNRRYGWAPEAAQIVTASGVIPALFALVDYCCQPDEKVLVMTPSYAFFQHAVDYNSRELVKSDLRYKDGEYQMNFADLRKKAAGEKTTLCIFCSPHNPTGRLWTESELRTFGEICLENGVTIIADEIHCDLLRAGETFTPLARLFPGEERIITCMAPSKTFNMAGFQLANVIIPNEELRAHWNDRHLPVVNPLSLAAAQAAYAEGQDWLTALTDYLDANFAFLEHYLRTELPEAAFRISDATYLAWVNLSAYFEKEENLTLFFANNAGVILEGGDMFVANSDGWIRLNLACPKAKLERGLERIVIAVREKANPPN